MLPIVAAECEMADDLMFMLILHRCVLEIRLTNCLVKDLSASLTTSGKQLVFEE